MKMLEVAARSNGSHRNQTFHGELPEGWALLPSDELESFPFGEVEVDTVDGLPTVVKWTPGNMPEVKQAEPEPNLAERVAELEAANAELTEALTRLMSEGTT